MWLLTFRAEIKLCVTRAHRFHPIMPTQTQSPLETTRHIIETKGSTIWTIYIQKYYLLQEI